MAACPTQPARTKTQNATTSNGNWTAERQILASGRKNICDLFFPNCADASSCEGERCTDIRLVTEKTNVCLVVNTVAI